MLLSRLLLLPFAVASSVTLYVSSVPASADSAVIPSPIPLAQIEYDADQSVGSLASFTPPTGSYSPDHLLRVGGAVRLGRPGLRGRDDAHGDARRGARRDGEPHLPPARSCLHR